eukprot:373338_1
MTSKNELNSDDELNCLPQVIVHGDGDHRLPIIESEYGDDDIIKCIGQLEVNFEYSEKQYKLKGWGGSTATVYTVTKNRCFVLCAAQAVTRRIKECKNCGKYYEFDTTTCSDCNKKKKKNCNDYELEKRVIDATSIRFIRRVIKSSVSFSDDEEKKLQFGDARRCYECKYEYIDDKYKDCLYCIDNGVKSGYDYCVLSFINDDNYNYPKFCKRITVKNEIHALKNGDILRFNIYGYP